ncbi:MAG: NAD+ synthase, partial [Acidobacteria bacterium]|nr:NAD+ synthase [Acidobacteriota bacterium]
MTAFPGAYSLRGACAILTHRSEAMRIALAQINTTVGDIEGNRDRVLGILRQVQAEGSADLVLFPELCLTGYPPRDILGNSGFIDANLRALEQIAPHCRRTGAVLGFVDRNRRAGGKRLHNAAAFICEGAVRARVHKTLLPTYDVFDEDRYFEPGERAAAIPFQGRRLGISICEDAWNAEEFRPRPWYSRDPVGDLVSEGADLLLNISASPFELDKPRARFSMLSAHVAKHALPFLYVNLVGGNDDLLFDGGSLALGRAGNLLAQGRGFEEETVIVDPDADCELGYSEEEPIAGMFQALVMGTRDYARKCGFRSAVLGLSGGIDSAVTACIAAAALGPDRVVGVSLPSAYSQQAGYEDASRLAQNLGIGFLRIPIETVFQEF